ncbi:universal stress protein [Pseudonocardia ailaonensis]
MTSTATGARPVVVGVDGSGAARRAAAWAAQEADLRDAPLLVICVAGPGGPSDPGTVLDRCAAVARIAAPDRTPEVRTCAGDPADVLERFGLDAELLVVGQHGGGRVRPGFGNTVARLARRHPAALAVVRAAPGRALPDRGRAVVVAVDGRPGSAALIEHAARVAALRGASLTIAHVEPGGRWSHRPGSGAAAVLAEVSEAVEAAHPEMVASARLIGGGPGRALLDLADAAQLVVVGCHRGRGAGGPVSGLLRAAACPVLIVDPDRLPAPVAAGPYRKEER